MTMRILPPDAAAADGAAAPAEPAMHHALWRLIASGRRSPDAILDFLAQNESPLVDPWSLTFLFHGEADVVYLMRFIHGAADGLPLARIEGTDLWHLRLPVEPGARFEYKLDVVRGGHSEWITDPLNPNRAKDPFGANSVAMGFDYERPEWSKPRGAPPGRFEEIAVASAAFGETRDVRVYLPAGYAADRRHPLLVVHDGDDFVNFANLTTVLDNLIDAGDIPPVVAALTQTPHRMDEYVHGRRHARFLTKEVLPLIEERYALEREAGGRVLLGASLGAVVSLSTAWRTPGVYGGLILKSGSFILDEAKLDRRPHPVFHRIARLMRVLRLAPDLPGTRAFVSTGELEGLADENRALALFLRERGVDVLFKSAWDGHHWHNWRDQLRDGLTWVLRPDDTKTG
jgi:enterochelin esterase family protein